jgi:hypothetical protein
MQKIGVLISESKASCNIVVERNGIRGEMNISTNVLSLKGEEEEIFLIRNVSVRFYKKPELEL